MKLSVLFILAAIISETAPAATITVTVTGTTGEIRVGEGPIFGHKSYTVIPPGDPFQLTYVFDDANGKEVVTEISDGLITESQIENAALSSPGISATLQIGPSVWEFGAAAHAKVVLKTSAAGKGEQFMFTTLAGGNRISAQIVPGKAAFWPRNGDWRASFTSGPLDGSTASFSADNDRVSAAGSLVPSAIAVAGVDIDGQWLQSTIAGSGEREWRLAHVAPQGGCIVEQVTRTIRGVGTDGSPLTPSSVKYWQAWPVPAGSDAPADPVDSFPETVPAGSTGEDNVSATARFYVGLNLPPGFAAGNSPYAGERPSSTIDPKLPTNEATLPVLTTFTVQLSTARSNLEFAMPLDGNRPQAGPHGFELLGELRHQR